MRWPWDPKWVTISPSDTVETLLDRCLVENSLSIGRRDIVTQACGWFRSDDGFEAKIRETSLFTVNLALSVCRRAIQDYNKHRERQLALERLIDREVASAPSEPWTS